MTTWKTWIYGHGRKMQEVQKKGEVFGKNYDMKWIPIIPEYQSSQKSCETEIVGNKAKGRISKRVFQESKARILHKI